MKSDVPLLAPINYSLANPFIFSGPTFVIPQSLSQNMAKITISFGAQKTVKLVLIIRENAGQQVLEISGMTRTGRVYKPADRANAK